MGQCHKYREYEINPIKIKTLILKNLYKKFFSLAALNKIRPSPIHIKVASGKYLIMFKKLNIIKKIAKIKYSESSHKLLIFNLGLKANAAPIPNCQILVGNKKKTKSILDTKYKFNPNEIEEIKIIPIRRYL
jgi:hypothetical protein|tara:strand:+ start:27 stop:422 length:396 start_codon:yes stop_codon:yes gene_type:complete